MERRFEPTKPLPLGAQWLHLRFRSELRARDPLERHLREHADLDLPGVHDNLRSQWLLCQPPPPGASFRIRWQRRAQQSAPPACSTRFEYYSLNLLLLYGVELQTTEESQDGAAGVGYDRPGNFFTGACLF